MYVMIFALISAVEHFLNRLNSDTELEKKILGWRQVQNLGRGACKTFGWAGAKVEGEAQKFGVAIFFLMC